MRFLFRRSHHNCTFKCKSSSESENILLAKYPTRFFWQARLSQIVRVSSCGRQVADENLPSQPWCPHARLLDAMQMNDVTLE